MCSICIRECPKGKSFCKRRDEGGNLKYKNRFCALLVDNLFDKPIIHFTKNIKVLSLGSWGCNLRCLGCQNPQLSWTMTGENLGYIEIEPKSIINLALENGCKGICYTYNEPAILLDIVEEIASEAKESGFFNFFITNSTLTNISIQRISPLMDAIAVDIKSMEDDFYYKYCGAIGIWNIADKILNCIKSFHDSGCHVEVRTNIIPGANDQDENFFEIARWIKTNLGKEVSWHITRFFPSHMLGHLSLTPTKTILRAQQIGLDEGLKYVYTYFSKGCDCANEIAMIQKSKSSKILVKSCCR